MPQNSRRTASPVQQKKKKKKTFSRCRMRIDDLFLLRRISHSRGNDVVALMFFLFLWQEEKWRTRLMMKNR